MIVSAIKVFNLIYYNLGGDTILCYNSWDNLYQMFHMTMRLLQPITYTTWWFWRNFWKVKVFFIRKTKDFNGKADEETLNFQLFMLNFEEVKWRPRRRVWSFEGILGDCKFACRLLLMMQVHVDRVKPVQRKFTRSSDSNRWPLLHIGTLFKSRADSIIETLLLDTDFGWLIFRTSINLRWVIFEFKRIHTIHHFWSSIPSRRSIESK
jgi:hypothetical protein